MKRTKLKLISYHIGFITIALHLFSCSAYYIPNEDATPMLSRPKEIIARGSISIGMRARSTNYNIAYSPVKNIGLAFHSSNYKDGTDGLFTDYYRKGNFNELSLGYYDLKPNKALFELYFSTGFGNSENIEDDDFWNTSNNKNQFNLRYNKTSISGAVGLVHENMAVSFGLKISNVYFSQIETIELTNSSVIEDMKWLENNRNIAFFEPNLTAKYGFKNFKFYSKSSFAIQGKTNSNFLHQQFLQTFGVQLQFNLSK